MPFCPHCGHETDQIIGIAPVTDSVDREVEIARINAERDIEVAKISARQDRDYNETRVVVSEIEAGAEVAAAEATAEVVAAVIESGTEADPEPDPVVISAPAVQVDEGQGDAEELPPAEGSPVPAAPKSRGLGMW